MPPFLGTTCTGLTHGLSDIGYMIPASRSFRISALTTSCMLGFNLLWCSTVGLNSSSIKILCIQIEGLNPLISEIDQPMAFLWLLSTLKSFSSSSDDKEAEMITGSDSDSPRKAYLKCSGSCFNSSFGGFSIDGGSLGFPSPNSSNLLLSLNFFTGWEFKCRAYSATSSSSSFSFAP